MTLLLRAALCRQKRAGYVSSAAIRLLAYELYELVKGFAALTSALSCPACSVPAGNVEAASRLAPQGGCGERQSLACHLFDQMFESNVSIIANTSDEFIRVLSSCSCIALRHRSAAASSGPEAAACRDVGAAAVAAWPACASGRAGVLLSDILETKEA